MRLSRNRSWIVALAVGVLFVSLALSSGSRFGEKPHTSKNADIASILAKAATSYEHLPPITIHTTLEMSFPGDEPKITRWEMVYNDPTHSRTTLADSRAWWTAFYLNGQTATYYDRRRNEYYRLSNPGTMREFGMERSVANTISVYILEAKTDAMKKARSNILSSAKLRATKYQGTAAWEVYWPKPWTDGDWPPPFTYESLIISQTDHRILYARRATPIPGKIEIRANYTPQPGVFPEETFEFVPPKGAKRLQAPPPRSTDSERSSPTVPSASPAG